VGRRFGIKQRANRFEQLGQLWVRVVVVRARPVAIDDEQRLKLIALANMTSPPFRREAESPS
jgi:hypothetical protein